jgi:hypothetical protein
MTDALAGFDFNQVSGAGLFVKFEADKPLKLRVLTVDPLVYIDKFANTRFAFIVYNLTDDKAQILQATPGMARRIGEIHKDEDFGANIQKVDIKITPTGAGMERRYTIQALPNAVALTQAQLKNAKEINLEDKIAKDAPMAQRMSYYDKEAFNAAQQEASGEQETISGYDKAKAVAEELRSGAAVDTADEAALGPINLDDIPF